MKKLFFFLALLLVCGSASAANIPTAVDAKNYPIVWTESVYNGSGSNISTGRVVVWDFDTSDSDASTYYDDICNWVKVTATANDPWTAGVVPIDNGILNGERGIIIIKGPAVVYDGTGYDVLTANDIVASSTTSGAIEEVSTVTTDGALLGVTILSNATNQGYAREALIYVAPTLFYDD